MAKSVARDNPLTEITFRKYEKPYNLSRRDAVKKLCLSLGLLQPGDSRDVIVDVFFVLLEAKKNRKELTSEDIKTNVIQLRKEEKHALLGIAASNIRRQIKRLREMHFIEKIRTRYRIAESSSLANIFEDKIERFVLPSTIDRVKEYLREVDGKFSQPKEEQ
ncbi:MAG TPA: hypothetical protein VI894_02070 [Candidatus Nanoarchaeia archaeon]|nr:hypothetical protein [Candidatus Nanoarchaeia archaeon]